MFDEEQVVEITGETKRYNGLEVDGVGAIGVPDGINYHFCTTCGSTLYHEMVNPLTGKHVVTVAVGNFADADFPKATTEFWTLYRHPWVPPVPGAVQLYDLSDTSVLSESMPPGSDSAIS
jgi:hypothetical protein